MDSRSFEITNARDTASNQKTARPDVFRRPSHDRQALADLTATVEKALKLADASGLILVGIDLCSALDRLKKLGDGDASNVTDKRDCSRRL